MRNLEHVKHVIIKIGSTSLCNEDGQLDKERILKLIQQIAILKRKGLKVKNLKKFLKNKHLRLLDKHI